MTKRKLATKSDYEGVISDRPAKFTPAEVGFRLALPSEPACGSCLHFFSGQVHNVCEIMRTPDEEVPFDRVCIFHTRDNEQYPLCSPEESAAEPEEEEEAGDKETDARP